jgi:hypothetical protein
LFGGEVERKAERLHDAPIRHLESSHTSPSLDEPLAVLQTSRSAVAAPVKG